MTTAITYQIRLDEPAIFSALEGDPNSAVSHPYIPGSALRGLLIGRYLGAYPTDDLAIDEDAQRLFFSEDTRFLNAYPVIDKVRSLPVPATWSVPKYKTDDKEFNRRILDSAFRLKDAPPLDYKPKPLSGFVRVAGETVRLYAPEYAFNVHTQRARRAASEQQVFRYEALADGQIFAGVILCDSPQDAGQLLTLLDESRTVVMGGSRSAGYGRMTVTTLTTEDDWQEAPTHTASDVVLTCLSDVIVTDAMGTDQPTPTALQRALSQMGLDCTVEPINLKTLWVGGFNRKWGLPLPQRLAIAKGSVVRLQGFNQTATDLNPLLTYGIGERKEDGYGRVAIGWQQGDNLVVDKVDEKVSYDAPPLAPESAKLWERLGGRIDEQQLDEAIIKTILTDARFYVSGGISRTQISGVRSLIANQLRDNAADVEAIGKFVTKLGNKRAGREFESSYINRVNLRAWLKAPDFFGVEGVDMSNQQMVLKLIDLVLERAHRERDHRTQTEEN